METLVDVGNLTASATSAQSCWGDIGFEEGFRIMLYALIFVSAVLGNTLVIVTLVQKRRMRTVTNVFLLNLAVSDLLLGVFCIPVTLVGSVLRNFVLGAAMCKIIPYIQAVSVSVSSWTLVSISLERFFAIVRPLESRSWQTTSHAYKVIFLVWGCSSLTMLPIAVLSQLVPIRGDRKKCREVWPGDTSERVFNVYLGVVLFMLPLIIMTFVYTCISITLCQGMKLDNKHEQLMSLNAVHEEYHTNPKMPQLITAPEITLRHQKLTRRPFILRGNYSKSRASKRRVIRMLFVLVLEFFVCWTPLYVLHTWTVFDAASAYSSVSPGGFAAVHLLAYVSSCCNPITYCFMHDKYRQSFKNLLRCSRPRRWSSSRAHDRFVSMNSIGSASRNINGNGSLRLTLASRLSSLKEESPVAEDEHRQDTASPATAL